MQRLLVFPWFNRMENCVVSPSALCGKSSEGERALKPTRCWRYSSVRVGARRSTGRGSARWVLVSHVHLGATASDLGSVGECADEL